MTTPVKLPAGKPRKVVIVAGIGAAAFLAYSYWTRSRTATPVDPSAVDPSTTALPDPTLPTVTTTTVPDNSNVISTNAQWTQRAVEYLSGQGFDGQFASATLGKFLARRGLAPNEEAVALAALAAFGQPPSGGPYYVTSTPVAPPSPMTSIPGVIPGKLNQHWTAEQLAAHLTPAGKDQRVMLAALHRYNPGWKSGQVLLGGHVFSKPINVF